MRQGARLLFAAAALAATAGPAAAQGPSVGELESIAAQREREISTLETRLRGLSAFQDSLVRAKSRAASGSARFQTLSNQILENSARIEPVQRDLRTHYTQLRTLKTEIYQTYNREIARTQQRIDELKGQGRTTRNSAEMRALVQRLPELVQGRNEVSTELEEIEEDLYLPELVYVQNDGPRDLRRKEAQAQDAVALIQRRIGAIENLIAEENRELRMRREADRLQRDLELWGDDRGTGDELEAVLQQQAGGGRPQGQGDPFGESPEQRIRRLQQRRLELLDRREEYRRKAESFAQLLREFYP